MTSDKHAYKIFVIEDNPGDFALVEDFLFEQIVTPKISHATTCNQALEILTDNKFDVILLDLSLPDRTGELLIEGIIELCKNTPVIVLTGYVDFSFGVKSISLGVSDYILKDELTAMSLYKSIIYSIERKKNILDLKQSEKRYSDLFNLSPLPMYVVDLETLKFLDVNNATVIHYGFSKPEFLNMTLKDIRPVEEIQYLYRGLEEDKRNPNENSSRLMIHKKKNGNIINVEVQIAPVQYKGKNASIVIATDITERLKYIETIEDQNEKLKEISWIQSHVVRGPLSRIMGLVPLASDNYDSLEEKEKILEYISSSANELDEIIKSITDKSKVEDFQPLMGKTTWL
ncbi:PAS domain S-box-containing protein [Mucilaginibacter frigoritolerans]|uniref:histidine kinase n=1 Tax=Mucilaginibacter frigoritolerans TaxID=652788 RepID=A0A562TRY2_9SPHI|nr:PAS domain S-box protein [Mucilaginibacter frigoritolerans]TWI95540.1 PAS domain S-box-containing protein [Mucilaginibacter frigoritolerans]